MRKRSLHALDLDGSSLLTQLAKDVYWQPILSEWIVCLFDEVVNNASASRRMIVSENLNELYGAIIRRGRLSGIAVDYIAHDVHSLLSDFNCHPEDRWRALYGNKPRVVDTLYRGDFIYIEIEHD